MSKKNIFGWVLIIAVAILVSGAIIFLPASAYSGAKQYAENAEVNAKPLAEPEEVVDAFYADYLGSIGDLASGTGSSPLADGTYRDSIYLTESFVEHIDDLLTDMDRGGYDPFLCAQDIPEGYQSQGTFQRGGVASVVLNSSFPGHWLIVDLQVDGDSWKISDITCGGTPEGTVEAFYTWYLAYVGDRTSDEFRNPLADGAYRESAFLTESLIQELDRLGQEGFQADPILMAQDIPFDFSVDPGLESGTAVVHLQFGTDSVRHLKVSLVQEGGSWKIDQIEADQP